jgi:hypothetical protein
MLALAAGAVGRKIPRARRSGDIIDCDGDPALLLKRSPRIGLCWRISASMVRRTLVFSHGVDAISPFLLVRSPAKVVAPMAAYFLRSRPVRCPVQPRPIAPLMAPQVLCPMTRISLAPGHGAGQTQAAGDVIVGNIAGHARVEAVADADVQDDLGRRARESMQLRIAAAGYWPLTVAARFWVGVVVRVRRAPALVALRAVEAPRPRGELVALFRC